MPTRFSGEEKQQHRELDVESLAKVVFRYLKGILDPNPESKKNFYTSVDNLIRALFPEEKFVRPSSDYYNLLQAITRLERRGLVVRDISSPQAYTRTSYLVYLTSIGIKSNIDDEVILLVDKPEEIVGGVEDKVGGLDLVVRQYYLESLRAYQEGLYISSVICLGAASERAIHWLAESAIHWLTESKGTQSERHRKGIQERFRKIPQLAEYLSHSIIPHVPEIDDELVGKLKKQLKELGDLYRENRNNAGHPKTIEQTSWLGEDQEILLIHFRRYISTICEAIERLKKRSAA